MKKSLIAAACAALVLGSTQSAAQTAQDDLDARYDRALAAGYMARMLCSAISSSERTGTGRTPESVESKKAVSWAVETRHLDSSDRGEHGAGSSAERTTGTLGGSGERSHG